jgi:putative oxidoreductase
MIEFILKTKDEWPGLILRVTTAMIMLPHGLQKLTGQFGGYGFKNTMAFFTGTMKLPYIVGVLVILIESIGSLLLLSGFLTRLWAMLFLILMIGAIATTHHKNGFFMNWFGNQPGEGFEYHLLFIGLCAALLFCGGGKLSADRYLLP